MLIVAEMDFLRSAVALQARNLDHMKSRDRSGASGMGEVYRAKDKCLDRTLRSRFFQHRWS